MYSLVAAAAILIGGVRGANLLDPAGYNQQDILIRDVAVIGGGSSGIYTAVRLRDHGKSVAVIEREAQIGGHAQTFTDPVTGTTFNIGVVVFDNIAVVRNYFERFHVDLVNLSSTQTPTTYVDFKNGEIVRNYQPPDQPLIAAAFKRYGAQLARYPNLQKSFNMSYPVASDLLLPFGDFVKKYDLGDMMAPVFAANQGYAPLLNITTIYMVKYLNAGELENFAADFLTTREDNTRLLYEAAGEFLEEANILLSSKLMKMERSASGVKMAVSTPSGKKLIIARKLVSTAPPMLSNLEKYDLVDAEKTLFGKFVANGYYTGVLNNTDLVSSKQSYSAAAPGQPYHVPSQPGIYAISLQANTTLTHVYFASAQILSDAEVKLQISNNLNALRRTLGKPSQPAEWVDFQSHAPFNLHVSPTNIQDRFYQHLYALNGQRSTFWNGAAFQSQDSSAIWQFTEDYVLPIVLGSLDR